MKNTITKEQVVAILAQSEVQVRTEFGKLTVVTVKLPNGFTIVESSGCVDPANYDEELGMEICMKRIEDRIWYLEGYRLQCELAIRDVWNQAVEPPMKPFRKRPVVIEAVQITDDTFDLEHPNPGHVSGVVYNPGERTVTIPTLEGEMTGRVGDWIIRGVKGELYPCKPDIFAATYEPA